MIHAIIRMKLSTRNVEKAVEILGSVVERTRVQPGCLSCRVYHDIQDQHVIMVEEVWRNQDTLDQHLRSPEYRNVLLVIEMADEKPEIKFVEISHSTGVETIEKAIIEGKGRGTK